GALRGRCALRRDRPGDRGRVQHRAGTHRQGRPAGPPRPPACPGRSHRLTTSKGSYVLTRQLDQIESLIRGAVEADPTTGRYRGDRRAFTDEQLFELEMKYIFEGNWVCLAQESQVPNPGDYFTRTVGRQPVVITRTRDGELQALPNTCSHRGATLCRKKRGNKSSFTCP